MLLGLGATGMVLAAGTEMQAQTGSGGDETVYELRVYHLNPGKLPLILERFRTKETALFVKAGMHPIAYWTPTEGALAGDKIIYIVRHKSREAAKESWAKFQADPEWKVVKAESEKDGAFVAQHDITFMKLTDFSPKL
ncbi:MAG TPA: NIPSNAP family protein [Acidobacteriaceae bacterium]|nr:NIPSNAP family protein [Acidobacteriaceae bacterium]